MIPTLLSSLKDPVGKFGMRKHVFIAYIFCVERVFMEGFNLSLFVVGRPSTTLDPFEAKASLLRSMPESCIAGDFNGSARLASLLQNVLRRV